jgi:hypothetical protein
MSERCEHNVHFSEKCQLCEAWSEFERDHPIFSGDIDRGFEIGVVAGQKIDRAKVVEWLRILARKSMFRSLHSIANDLENGGPEKKLDELKTRPPTP